MRGQIVRFAVAGVFGFVVDAGVLYLALHVGAGPYVGRVISFLCAVFATWQINRRYTFRSTVKRSMLREWNEYLLAMAFGGVCNYGVYVLAIRLLPPMALAPFFAVAVGSIAGMFVNFCTAKMWVFRHARSDKT